MIHFPAECKADFRVEKADIPLLIDALRMRPEFVCGNGTVCDATEGLCILPKRFAYPCRYSDMIPIFGRLSVVSNEITDMLYTNHGHRVTHWNHRILSSAMLDVYATAIYRKGAAPENCFGFIDGTVRPISRPIINQRTVYNGHKRVHALTFHSVTLPNCLIGHLYGAVGDPNSCYYYFFQFSNVRFYFFTILFLYSEERCTMLGCWPCQISTMNWRILPFPPSEQKCVFMAIVLSAKSSSPSTISHWNFDLRYGDL